MKLLKLLSVHSFVFLTSISVFADEEKQPAQPAAPAPTAAAPVAAAASSTASTGTNGTSTPVDYAKNANGDDREKEINRIKSSMEAAQKNLLFGGAKMAAEGMGKQVRKLEEYRSSSKACASREKTAELICREKTNPTLVQSIPVIQAIVTSVAGAKDACSKFAKASDALNKALVVYQATCATTKTLCQSSCAKAETLIKNMNAQVPKIIENGRDTIVQNAVTPEEKALKTPYITALTELEPKVSAQLEKELGEDPTSVSSNLQTCTGFNNQLASAAVGLVGIIQSMGQSNKCDKQMTANNTPPATEVNCSLPQNANLTKCICEANPRAVGCATGLNNPANAKSADMLAPSDLGSASLASQKDPAFVGGGNEDNMTPPDSAGTGPGGAPAPTGGGPGMDGGSGGAGGPQNAEQKAGSRLNANVLGAEGGGGGGGGGWGSYGEEASDDQALRQYLPGGEKDPTGMAGQVATKEVTSEGGKSNWEKVRERYRDNKPTLLGY